MPAIMVIGRLRLVIATASAITPAIHSAGPPFNKSTVTKATIRHPGSAFSARAQGPEVGSRSPSKTPDNRIENVPTANPTITHQCSVIVEWLVSTGRFVATG